MNEPARKILCIEDDAETAELISEALLEHGFAVTVAHDGEAAWRPCCARRPTWCCAMSACRA